MVNAARELNNGIKDADYKFIRKGKVGAYKEEMSEEYIKKFDDWIEENLKDSDFKFREQ